MNQCIESLSPIAPAEQLSKETRPKVALALGAGGALGCAHIGVIRALEQLGVEIKAVAGSSMGALVAAFLAEEKLAQLEAFLRKTNARTMLGYMNFPRKSPGIVSSEKLDDLLRGALGDVTIEEMKMPYAAMAMEWGTWDSIVLNTGDLVESVVISSSIPLIFSRKKHKGRTVVDGGFSSLVPLPAIRQLSKEKVVAVGVARGAPIIRWARRKYAERQWRNDRPELDIFLELEKGAVRYDQAQEFIDAGYKFIMNRREPILQALAA